MQHQIEYLPIEAITPYDNNPRSNDAAVEPVAKSIKAFGFQAPIIVDKDHVIIAGHTRYKAARRLKLKTVPVVVAAELTDEQARAYRIADNSTGEVAQWEIELLQAEIAELEYDFAEFGLHLELESTVQEAQDDNFEVIIPDEPICQPGQVWLLGEHRLMCGDSTDPRDVDTLMDGAQADLLLTDGSSIIGPTTILAELCAKAGRFRPVSSLFVA